MRFQVCLIALLCAIVASVARGQTSAINFDFETGLLLSVDHSPDLVNRFGPLSNGGGVGSEQQYRLTYHHDLVSLSSPSLVLEGGAGLGYSLGSFVSNTFPVPATGGTGQFTIAYSGIQGDLNLGLDARLSFASLRLGAWTSLPLSRSSSETFAAPPRADTVIATTAILTPQIPYGLQAEFEYRGLIIRGLPLHPAVFGRIDLSQLSTLGISASTFGMGLHWQLDEKSDEPLAEVMPATIPPADSIPSPVPQEHPSVPLTANLYFVNDGVRIGEPHSATVGITDTLFRNYVMLPSFVVSDPGAPDPLARYRLLTREGAARFSLDSLVQLSAQDVCAQMLNILGLRMTENPELALTLTATNEEQRNTCNRLRMYFLNTWGIASSRVQVETAKQSADRIAISTATPALLEPIAVQWIERNFDLASVAVDYAVGGGNGPRTATVSVLQDGHTLLQTSVSAETTRRIKLNTISAAAPSETGSAGGNGDLVVRLTARDSTMQSVTRDDTLHLVVPAGRDPAVQARVFRYVVLPGEASERTRAKLYAKILENGRSAKASSMLSIGDSDDPSGFRVFHSGVIKSLNANSWSVERKTAARKDLLGPCDVIVQSF